LIFLNGGQPREVIVYESCENSMQARNRMDSFINHAELMVLACTLGSTACSSVTLKMRRRLA
jgi:hypothetical protein